MSSCRQATFRHIYAGTLGRSRTSVKSVERGQCWAQGATCEGLWVVPVSLSSVISRATRPHTAMAENKGIHSVTHGRGRRKVHREHEHLGWGPRKEISFTGNRLVYAKMFFLKRSPWRSLSSQGKLPEACVTRHTNKASEGTYAVLSNQAVSLGQNL